MTGALLHDIGKLDAYELEAGAISMSDHGRLQGEIPLGYYRVRRTIERLDGFPPELAQAVLHIILSHHGSLEHGSPVVPCTREATLVHMIDNLGGQLGSFDRLEKELPAGQQWSAYDKALGGGAYFAAPRRGRARSRVHSLSRLRVRHKRPQIAFASPTGAGVVRPSRPNYSCGGHGQGHGKADPSAVADLVSDGGTASGDGQEIRRDVEGYSAMNEDAFARRFYADRSELEALRIYLSVEKPVDGLVEQETYSLAPENFHLPPIEFTDQELAALHTALQLLDGEFAYAEPLRLALQQISWGRPSPLSSPEQHTVALGHHRLRRRP